MPVTGPPVASMVGTPATLCVAPQGATLAAAAIAPSVPVADARWSLNEIPTGLQRPAARTCSRDRRRTHALGRVDVTTWDPHPWDHGVGALAAGSLATATNVSWPFAPGGPMQLAGATVTWSVLARLRGARPAPGLRTVAADQDFMSATPCGRYEARKVSRSPDRGG